MFLSQLYIILINLQGNGQVCLVNEIYVVDTTSNKKCF